MQITINAMAAATRSSGLTLIPSVSSSKNLKSPALAAGIGADSLFFFLLIEGPTYLAYVVLHY